MRILSAMHAAVGWLMAGCLVLGASVHGQSPHHAGAVAGQAAAAGERASKEKIARQLENLEHRQKAEATAHELAIRWGLIGAEYGNGGDVVAAESAYNRAFELVPADTLERELYADLLDQLGALYRIYGRTADTLSCYRRALEVRTPFLDPLEDARSRARLAEVALETHAYKEAYTETDQAYQSMRRMFDPDESEVISTLIVRAYARAGLRHIQEAEQDAREALDLSGKEYGEDSMQAAAALTALGFAQRQDRKAAEAERSLHQAMGIFEGKLGASDPRLIFAKEQYREVLAGMHRKEAARRVKDELEALARQPLGTCANCTVSAFSMRTPATAEPGVAPARPAGAQAVKCPLSSPGAVVVKTPAGPAHPEP